LSRAVNAINRIFGASLPARGKAHNKKKQGNQKGKAPQHRVPTIELWDVRRLASLSVRDMSGVAVVMPCIDKKMGIDWLVLIPFARFQPIPSSKKAP
jgi:hypothetical protein